MPGRQSRYSSKSCNTCYHGRNWLWLIQSLDIRSDFKVSCCISCLISFISFSFFHFFMQIVIKSNKVTPAALASLQDILLLLCNDIERNPGPSKL